MIKRKSKKEEKLNCFRGTIKSTVGVVAPKERVTVTGQRGGMSLTVRAPSEKTRLEPAGSSLLSHRWGGGGRTGGTRQKDLGSPGCQGPLIVYIDVSRPFFPRSMRTSTIGLYS